VKEKARLPGRDLSSLGRIAALRGRSPLAQGRRERIGFLIEAIKRGIPAKEIPVTVQKRHTKKPVVVRYGLGFTNAIVRTWLR
jgi:hypothetical protein